MPNNVTCSMKIREKYIASDKIARSPKSVATGRRNSRQSYATPCRLLHSTFQGVCSQQPTSENLIGTIMLHTDTFRNRRWRTRSGRSCATQLSKCSTTCQLARCRPHRKSRSSSPDHSKDVKSPRRTSQTCGSKIPPSKK